MRRQAHEEIAGHNIVISVSPYTRNGRHLNAAQGLPDLLFRRPLTEDVVAFFHGRFIGLENKVRMVTLIDGVLLVFFIIRFIEILEQWPGIGPPEIVAVIPEDDPLGGEFLLEGVMRAAACGETGFRLFKEANRCCLLHQNGHIP